MRRALAAWLPLLAACSAPRTHWDGTVETWGTMREVMRDGRTEGRVELASAVRGPRSFGIGALAGLEGEIVILDGVVWTSRVRSGKEVETRRGLVPGDRATLLAACEVDRWSERTIPTVTDLAGLESLLGDALEEEGLRGVETVPFVVEGELEGLEAHVLDGACPYAGDLGEQDHPARERRAKGGGTLAGFFTRLAPGTLTHHGSRLHVHVLVRGDRSFVGHVDEVALAAGAKLRLPAGG